MSDQDKEPKFGVCAKCGEAGCFWPGINGKNFACYRPYCDSLKAEYRLIKEPIPVGWLDKKPLAVK